MSDNKISDLIQVGTKLWIDSVDSDLVERDIKHGATGATSNPIIISELIKNNDKYQKRLGELKSSISDSNELAWSLTNEIVTDTEETFLPIWNKTNKDDGYVSFELDPLIEEPNKLSHKDQVLKYIELAKKWSKDHPNRLIKIPATTAGLDAIEPITALGINLNITLIFTLNQYLKARAASVKGAANLQDLSSMKHVYSIFVSRVDSYVEGLGINLSDSCKGYAGICNAKNIWENHNSYFKENPTPLKQEIVFASTGTKNPNDPPCKYVLALAGSDIQTNPPQTNQAISDSDVSFSANLLTPDPETVKEEIFSKIDWQKLEDDLMAQGVEKFCAPQRSLLASV